ncbi:MAG: aminotransferase class V-fold PLP-dependent enzyme [Patescibacteria group bacterium]
MKKRIYLDHAATASMDPRVKKAMDDFFIKEFGNPSALYQEGRKAKKAIEQSRIEVAKIINCKPSEIIFTNGGTESDNLAIFGVAFCEGPSFALRRRVLRHRHIITTKIEHHAVLNPIKFLEKNGFDVTYLVVVKDLILNPEDFK